MPACLAAYWKASPRLGTVVKRGIKDILTKRQGWEYSSWSLNA